MRLRRHRAVWVGALIVAAVATIAGLWIVTAEVRRLEQRQAATLREVAEAEVVRLALWRMDSWMTPRLAREAARSIGEYSAFYSPGGTVNRMLQSVPEGEVLSPSPLLLSTPDWIPIYFEADASGALTSPQIPVGNLRDLAEGQYLNEQAIERRKESLDRVRRLISSAPQSLEACTAQAESASVALDNAWRAGQAQRESKEGADQAAEGAASAGESGAVNQGSAKTKLSRRDVKQEDAIVEAPGVGGGAGGFGGGALSDLATRARASNEAQQGAQQSQAIVDERLLSKKAAAQSSAQVAVPSGGAKLAMDEIAPAVARAVAGEGATTTAYDASSSPLSIHEPVTVGAFSAAWLSTSPPELVFVRRVRDRGVERIQGFLVDWPTLSTHLVAQVADIARVARLVPSTAGVEAYGPARLASIPADLVADSFVTAAPAGLASSGAAVRFAWIAAVLALLGAGAAAIAGVSFGDRQARFASSVTHELRTPLTTFQLYAEMLRDGMIPDAARRQECLETLCRESRRLSHLVENVLSLARVERGAKSRHCPTDIDESALRSVIDAISRERAADSVVTVTGTLGSATLRIDHDALSQILANLIENAAKYGRAKDGSSAIAVSIGATAGALVVRVRDHGAGVPVRHESAIWRPFDRAGAEASNQPGLGLGLAVSRALADGVGGTLRLVAPADGAPGACFELTVPGAVSREARK